MHFSLTPMPRPTTLAHVGLYSVLIPGVGSRAEAPPELCRGKEGDTVMREHRLNARILVVDDEPAVLVVFMEVLAAEGYFFRSV